jgi:hypothetical protein
MTITSKPLEADYRAGMVIKGGFSLAQVSARFLDWLRAHEEDVVVDLLDGQVARRQA